MSQAQPWWAPFEAVEIKVISAQDLAAVSKATKAYAVVSLPPHRKLSTQVDPHGHTNPTWNHRFVFPLHQHACDDHSTLIVEIYSSSWLRDLLIGTVAVNLRNLLPPSPKPQLVALQIRRPSGRPRGILNIGLTLLPSSANTTADEYASNLKPNLFTRSQKDDSSSIITNGYVYHPTTPSYNNNQQRSPRGFNENEAGAPRGRGMIINANGSLCSDVGPSSSVVAAAIAKGLYPVPLGLDEWREKSSTEGMERWRREVPPVYRTLRGSPKQNGRRVRSKSGLCSCFGAAMGIEFSISCGGGNRKNKYGTAGKGHLTQQSELTYDASSYM